MQRAINHKGRAKKKARKKKPQSARPDLLGKWQTGVYLIPLFALKLGSVQALRFHLASTVRTVAVHVCISYHSMIVENRLTVTVTVTEWIHPMSRNSVCPLSSTTNAPRE
ncbi:hypothetical protein MAP00_004773 [Monascus purpureus]|nr:hypothetical protein MAP00_004773 [Monascus purpureus]